MIFFLFAKLVTLCRRPADGRVCFAAGTAGHAADDGAVACYIACCVYCSSSCSASVQVAKQSEGVNGIADPAKLHGLLTHDFT